MDNQIEQDLINLIPVRAKNFIEASNMAHHFTKRNPAYYIVLENRIYTNLQTHAYLIPRKING